MREIKFRVWDKSIPKNIDEAESETPTGSYVSWDYVKKSSYLEQAFRGDYPLEQYTGLRDKNGIEIYENDILKSFNGKLREVGFNDRRCQFGLYSRQLECWITNELIDDTWEIIGNIHEELK